MISIYDGDGRLIDVRCEPGGRTCPFLAAFTIARRPVDPTLAAALYLIDLFGED